MIFSVIVSVVFGVTAVNEKRKYENKLSTYENLRSIRIYGEICNYIESSGTYESAAIKRSLETLIDEWTVSEDIKFSVRSAVKSYESGDDAELIGLRDYVRECVKTRGADGNGIKSALCEYFANKTVGRLSEYSKNVEYKSVPNRSMHVEALTSKTKRSREKFFGNGIKMKSAYLAGDLLAKAEYCENAYIICSVGGNMETHLWGPHGFTDACVNYSSVENAIAEISSKCGCGDGPFMLDSAELRNGMAYYSYKERGGRGVLLVGVEADSGNIVVFAFGKSGVIS